MYTNRYYTKKQRRKYMFYWYLDAAITIIKQVLQAFAIILAFWVMYVSAWAIWG